MTAPFQSAREEYDAYVARHGTPERIELMLCDINAVLRGKWLPPGSIDKLDKGAVRLPISAHAPSIMGYDINGTGLGIEVGDPDGILTPVLGTMRPVPWAAEPAAQMLIDMNGPDGELSYLSTRRILADIVDRFAEMGLRPVVAAELEFYVLRRRKFRDDPPEPPKGAPDAQNYDLETLSRHEEFVRALSDAAERQELDVDSLLAEFGQGQFEINFHHSEDVLGAADTALFFKRLVREVAAKHDLEATFMAKPYADQPGNGMHLHLSLLNEAGENVFNSETAGNVATPLRHAVAGLVSTMAELQAVLAPHLNSYRRFQPNSFAPSTPDWGVDNRAAGIRLPEAVGPAARLEHRIAGADVNPYLAMAAVLGGVLEGLERAKEPPLPLDDPQAKPAERLCQDWAAAVDAFSTSETALDLFGKRFCDVYVAIKRGEIETIASAISPIEYRYYLSRF